MYISGFPVIHSNRKFKKSNKKSVVSNIGSRNMQVWGCEVMALCMLGLVVTVPVTLVHALVCENTVHSQTV